MKKFLSIMVVFGIISLIPYAFSELDLSNKQLVSSDENLIIQFSENKLSFHRLVTSITPQIDFGIVTIDSLNFILDEADVNLLGDSLSVKTNQAIIYAQNTGNDNFKTNVYYLTGQGLKSKSFSTSLISSESFKEKSNSIQSETKTEVHFLVRSMDTVKPKQEFEFAVKTYDKSIYSGTDFTKFEGELNGVLIKSRIMDLEGKLLHEFSGETQYGIFEDSIRVPERLWGSGWKTLEIDLEYQGKLYQYSKPFYLFTNPYEGNAN